MTAAYNTLAKSLNSVLSIGIPETDTNEMAREKLYDYINHLIAVNFEKLVLILYRIDVQEDKLKQLLQQHPTTDAAVVIGNLIIERELQKIKSRQAFVMPVNEINDDDKW